MPRIIQYDDQIQRQGPSGARLRAIDHGPSGLAAGFQAAGQAIADVHAANERAEALEAERQRLQDISDEREAQRNDLYASYFWQKQRDRIETAPGHEVQAVRAAIGQEADTFGATLLKQSSSPMAAALTEKALLNRRLSELGAIDARVVAKMDEADDAQFGSRIAQSVRDFRTATENEAGVYLVRGEAAIVEHGRRKGWSEAEVVEASNAYLSRAFAKRIEALLDRGDLAEAGPLFDRVRGLIGPEAEARFAPVIERRTRQEAVQQDVAGIVKLLSSNAAPPPEGRGAAMVRTMLGDQSAKPQPLDLQKGLALIADQDWAPERKADVATELQRQIEMREAERRAGEDEAARALGDLLDQQAQAGAPLTDVDALPLSILEGLAPEVLEDLRAAKEAQRRAAAGTPPQPNGPLVAELTRLAVTDPQAFRRRLVHPDLIHGRVTEAEASDLWRMRQAIEQGTNDGMQPTDILDLVREKIGKTAATPEEQAREGHLVFRIYQGIPREFPNQAPKQEELRKLVADYVERTSLEAETGASGAASAAGRWDGIYGGIRFKDNPDLQRSAFLLGAYDGAVPFDIRLGVTEEQLGHLPPEAPQSLAGQLIAENPIDSRRLIFLLARLKQGAQDYPNFSSFLAPQIAAIEAEIARRMPDIEAAERLAGRAAWDVLDSALPTSAFTGAYRMGVNDEYNAENAIPVGAALIPGVGKAAGRIAGKIVDKLGKAASRLTTKAGKGVREGAEEVADVSGAEEAARTSNAVDEGAAKNAASDPQPVPNPADFPPVGTRISKQGQTKKHLGPEAGKGFVHRIEDAQAVLDAFHSGEATILGRTKAGYWVVRVDHVTGVNVNRGPGYPLQETNVFLIKGTNKVSVVPTNPNWKPE